MEAAYHIDILKRSIGHRVPSQALEIMIAANLGQDSLIGLTHLEYHFDANLFEMSQSYVDGQRILAQRWWGRPAGWAAFGRLSHTVADFYAHSNYVRLWLAGALGSAPGQVELPPRVRLNWRWPVTRRSRRRLRRSRRLSPISSRIPICAREGCTGCATSSV